MSGVDDTMIHPHRWSKGGKPSGVSEPGQTKQLWNELETWSQKIVRRCVCTHGDALEWIHRWGHHLCVFTRTHVSIHRCAHVCKTWGHICTYRDTPACIHVDAHTCELIGNTCVYLQGCTHLWIYRDVPMRVFTEMHTCTPCGRAHHKSSASHCEVGMEMAGQVGQASSRCQLNGHAVWLIIERRGQTRTWICR